jgi:ABC-type polysaccharide/polyol phosphate export permease
LLPWTAFSESFAFSTTLIGANSNLVKRVVFPLEVLPLTTVLTNTLQLSIGLLLLLPLAWLVGGRLTWSVLFIPLLLLLQLLFYSGLTWIWASLSVYIPDLRQFTSLLLMVIMFMTPIFYPIDIVPEWAVSWMSLNPFAQLVTMYRRVIIEGALPSLNQFFWLLVVSLISFMVGYFWFMKTKKGFADVL